MRMVSNARHWSAELPPDAKRLLFSEPSRNSALRFGVTANQHRVSA